MPALKSPPLPSSSSSLATWPTIKAAIRSLPSTGTAYVRSLPARYRALKPIHKAFIWVLVGLHVVFISTIVAIGPKAIGDFFTRMAAGIERLGWPGYFIVGLMVAGAATPPLFGFASSLTFCGFTYGLWPGVLIAMIGTLAGSSFAFGLYRFVFRRQFRSLVGSGSEGGKWAAFQTVIKSKSLGLLIALRWCPLPFALSNGFFGSMEAVSYRHFIIATSCMLPRTALIVFVGSRLDSLADSKERQKTDKVTMVLNLLSMGVALSVSLFTGWYIYHQLLQHLPQLPPDDPSAPSLEHGSTSARGGRRSSDALLLNFTDDYSSEDEVDAEPLPPPRR